ncbi:Ornithine decarboxylase [Exaiptasia diaphana]|nr:Ornithine decarboxylase [Exaiptasia diaphana]
MQIYKAIVITTFSRSFFVFGQSFKLGARIEGCADILATAKELGLNVVGVSFHVGSDCFNEMCFKDCIYISRQIFDQALLFPLSFEVSTTSLKELEQLSSTYSNRVKAFNIFGTNQLS